jgi:hypothetical protein
VVNGVLASERQTGVVEYPSTRAAVPTMSS